MGYNIENNLEHIKALIDAQIERVNRIKDGSDFTDFNNLDQIVIGTIAGDGIGPVIMDSALAVLSKLLEDEIASGKVVIKEIEGLTIENRIARCRQFQMMYLQKSKLVMFY